MMTALAPFIGLVGAAVILANPFLGLVLLVFFAQLEGLLDLLAQGLPGMKILAAITLAGTVMTFCREDRKERLLLDEPATLWAVAFFLAILLSALFADDRSVAFDTVRRLGTMILFYFLAAKLCSSPGRIEKVVLAMILSAMVTSLIIIYDKHFGGALLDAFDVPLTVSTDRDDENATYTAAAAYVLVGTALSALVLLRSRRLRMLTTIGFVIGTCGLIFSLSRSSAIGYAIAAPWLLWRYRRSRHLLPAVTVFCLVAVIVVFALPEEYAARLAALSADGSRDWTLERRWTYHIVGLDLFRQHPLLGVGPGNFPLHYISTDYRWLPGHTFDNRSLHNMYLEALSETGLIGSLFFFGFLLAALHRCWSFLQLQTEDELNTWGEALFFAFVLYLIVSFTLPNLVNKYVWLLAGIAVAVGRVGHERARRAALADDEATQLRTTPARRGGEGDRTTETAPGKSMASSADMEAPP